MYEMTEWKAGDKVTAEKLNKMEAGISMGQTGMLVIEEIDNQKVLRGWKGPNTSTNPANFAGIAMSIIVGGMDAKLLITEDENETPAYYKVAQLSELNYSSDNYKVIFTTADSVSYTFSSNTDEGTLILVEEG